MKSQIDIMSRDAMKKLLETKFPDNTAVISFYDPPKERCLTKNGNYKPLDYSGVCDHAFSIGIHDIDIEILGDYGLTYETYFPEAHELALFIYDAVDNGMNIICQCEYGQSRSAACAAAIKEHFERCGIEVFADYRYYPNQLIFNKLRTALNNVGTLHDR